MNQQGFLPRNNGPVQTKILNNNIPHLNSNSIPLNSQPRLSHNVNYTNSNKDLNVFKEENMPKRSQNIALNNNYQSGQHFSSSTRLQSSNGGSINSGKNPQTGPSFQGNNQNAPKSIPTFLQNKTNMKGSLFMQQQQGLKHSGGLQSYKNLVQTNPQKRAPRVSQQPGDMKFSSIQSGENYKVPSFLQKKAPYQNQLERPESSKQVSLKAPFQVQSLSNSYGSMKRSKIEPHQFSQQKVVDLASQWVKQSWSKKKQKSLSITDFQKISDLGSGKYGQVYLARQKKTNYILAVKIIQKRLLKQQEITEQFIRQLKIQSYLNHPNIIRMFGFFDDAVNIYILLEVGTGGQLFKQIKKNQSMAEHKVAALMRQVCQAVNELHSHQIIHRDIKPQNIVLSEGVVKLCDFGWSVYSGQTLRTTFCGTPLYVGPQILKGKEYDQKIDIWSLGVMMYEMLVGQNPFKITKEQQLIKIVKDEIKIPTYVQISEQAKDFLFSCLQKNPESRLSIRELLNHSFFKKYPQKTDKKMAL